MTKGTSIRLWAVIAAVVFSLGTVPPALGAYFNENVRLANYQAVEFEGSDNTPRAEIFVRPTDEFVMKYKMPDNSTESFLDTRIYGGWPQVNFGLFAPFFVQIAAPEPATEQNPAVDSNYLALAGEFWSEKGVISNPVPQSLHRQWVFQNVMEPDGNSTLVIYYGKIENNENDNAPLEPVMRLSNNGTLYVQCIMIVNGTGQTTGQSVGC